jgi:hypothetical protein
VPKKFSHLPFTLLAGLARPSFLNYTNRVLILQPTDVFVSLCNQQNGVRMSLLPQKNEKRGVA